MHELLEWLLWQLQLNYYFANHNAKGDVNCLIDFDIDFMVSKLFVSVVASNLHQSWYKCNLLWPSLIAEL